MVRESDSWCKGCEFESRFSRDCGWSECTALSLHPQYHDWGALEQDTKPSTAPRAPQAAHCSGCVFTVLCVCVHLGWVKCKHKFRVWVTILGRITSLSLIKNGLITMWFWFEILSVVMANWLICSGLIEYLRQKKWMQSVVVYEATQNVHPPDLAK